MYTPLVKIDPRITVSQALNHRPPMFKKLKMSEYCYWQKRWSCIHCKWKYMSKTPLWKSSWCKFKMLVYLNISSRHGNQVPTIHLCSVTPTTNWKKIVTNLNSSRNSLKLWKTASQWATNTLNKCSFWFFLVKLPVTVIDGNRHDKNDKLCYVCSRNI